MFSIENSAGDGFNYKDRHSKLQEVGGDEEIKGESRAFRYSETVTFSVGGMPGGSMI
eukprot:CAMPEP_0183773504 /NCGR_PEP_ID=MMETSP0739-20130205/39198_1 /TAXON_ID=385413 /ORGANISM="Thalassiosira miniscula, Strain CCMP1093" /LENGTH=56 /DNA_ID=CAMNT_0026014497 /DNA_START=315 /DNA_END=482 /DNA_ORIENTATION=-